MNDFDDSTTVFLAIPEGVIARGLEEFLSFPGEAGNIVGCTPAGVAANLAYDQSVFDEKFQMLNDRGLIVVFDFDTR